MSTIRKTMNAMLVMVILALLFCVVGTKAVEIDYPAGYCPYYNESSAQALAKLMWAEARGIKSDTQKAAVAWVVINRVEAGYGDMWQVLTAPRQFAYRKGAPVDGHLYELAKDVLIRWDMERCGYTDVGRIIPVDYLWFNGDGKKNNFRNAYKNGTYWKWSLPSPYDS